MHQHLAGPIEDAVHGLHVEIDPAVVLGAVGCRIASVLLLRPLRMSPASAYWLSVGAGGGLYEDQRFAADSGGCDQAPPRLKSTVRRPRNEQGLLQQAVMSITTCFASRDEQCRPMPGDGIVSDPMATITDAVTVDARSIACGPGLHSWVRGELAGTATIASTTVDARVRSESYPSTSRSRRATSCHPSQARRTRLLCLRSIRLGT